MEPLHIFVSSASAPHVSSGFPGMGNEEGSGVLMIGLLLSFGPGWQASNPGH
jgi:hypothetical protein